MIRARACWTTAAATAALLATAAPSTARAYEEQVGLWVVAGYTGIVGDTPMPPHAIHAGLGVGVGLGDTWELRGRLDYAHHVSAANRLSGSVDLVYVLDVLSVVPYLGVGLGGAVTLFEPSLLLGEVRGDFLAGAVLGLDFLLGREWTIGVEIRPTWVVTSFDAEPFVLTALARGQVLFEI